MTTEEQDKYLKMVGWPTHKHVEESLNAFEKGPGALLEWVNKNHKEVRENKPA